MDPKSQGVKSCQALLRLVDGDPRVSDWETIEKWKMRGTQLKSSSNRIGKIDEEIEVLVNAKAIALESRETLQTEITRKEAERNKLELSLFKALAFKKMKGIQILQQDKQKLILQLEEQTTKIDIVQSQLADDRRRAEELKVTVNSLGTQLAEKDTLNDALKRNLVTLATHLGKMELEKRRESQEALISTVYSLERQLTETAKANDVLKKRVLSLKSEIKCKSQEKDVQITDLG